MLTLIQELLNTGNDFKILHQDADEFRASAIIDDRKIVVLFLRSPAEARSPEYWFVEFFDEDQKGERDLDLNGKGSEFKIFAMVMSSLKKFIQLYQPKTIKFEAVGKRAQLYRRLVNKIPNYTVDEDHGHASITHFTLEKE